MKTKYLITMLAAVWLISSDVRAQVRKLSLSEAVAIAAEHNPELKASRLDITKAIHQKTIARSLFLPSVNATASINHFFQLTPFFGFGENNAGGRIPYGRFGGPDQFAAGVIAMQPLYNPAAFPTMTRARLQERESRIEVSGKEILILSEIKQTYLRLLIIDKRIALQQESIRRNSQVLTDAKALFLQGKAIRVDTLRAYTSLKNLEPDLLSLQNASETGILRLKTLIGLDTLQKIQLTDSLFLPDPGSIPNVDEVYETAKQNNPEMLAAVLQQELANQQRRQAAAARLPVISAVGFYQVQTQTRSFDYGNAAYPSSSYVGIQMGIPVFSGFSNQAKGRQATLSKEQAALRVGYTAAQLRVAIHEAVTNGHESVARLHTTADVQETAELSYNIIQYRYVKGIASRIELSDAELALVTSQSNYLEAIYQYLSARIAIDKLMGKAE